MRIFFVALFTFVLAAAAGGAAETGTTHAVAVTQPWARATPGGAQTGAVYLTIRAAQPDRLVGATTPVAKAAELHEMEMAGMVMKMRPLAAVPIPAGRSVVLAPGGIHIMLMGLKMPLRAGETFPLTLTFAKAGPQTVTVAVGKVGAMGPPAAAH